MSPATTPDHPSGPGRPRGGRRSERGYEILPSGACRIRMAGFPREVVADELAAQMRVAELRLARRDGNNPVAAPAGALMRTLGEAAEAFLVHKLARGGRVGEFTAAGRKHWTLATRPWREGPLAGRQLRSIGRDELQAVIDARTRTNRTSAHNEGEGLLAVLRHAQGSDVAFAASLLAVEVPRKQRRTRRDLTTVEFDYLIGFADERWARALQLASTLGWRLGEALALERSWVKLDERRILIPLEATKEKRPKQLDLTNEELDLLRSALLDVYQRLGDRTRYVFPRAGGTRWSPSSFREDVWAPAKRRAMVAWLTELGDHDPAAVVSRRLELQGRRQRDGALTDEEREELDVLPATPFDEVTLHTLRRTAVGWLRASGLPVEVIAQRLGHNDGGATLLRHYRYVRPDEARAALDSLGAGVRSALRGGDEDGAR